eukprot:197411-Prymnesium_polylepis.1
MYGREYADAASDSDDRVQLAIGDQIVPAIQGASAFCIICDLAPLEEGPMRSAVEAASGLERVVLLSQIGVTRATGGFMGKSDIALLDAEKRLREAVASKGAELSIIRCGALKGGGPGVADDEVRWPRPHNIETPRSQLGLAKTYYDSLLDLQTAMVTQSCTIPAAFKPFGKYGSSMRGSAANARTPLLADDKYTL